MTEVLEWLGPVALGQVEMSCRKLESVVSSYAQTRAEKTYSDAAAAKAVGIKLGTRYLWGRELGVTFPADRPLKPNSVWDRVCGALPTSLAAYFEGDWFWQTARGRYDSHLKPLPARWSEELVRAGPEDNFFFLIRIVKKQKEGAIDVVQQILPCSSLGTTKGRNDNRYDAAKLRTPFELTSLRLARDYDDMKKDIDVFEDDSDAEPTEEEYERHTTHYIPYAKAKWQAHRAAFHAANADVKFRGIVHVVRRDTQQYACVFDQDDLEVEREDTTDGRSDPAEEPPRPTFGNDTVALRERFDPFQHDDILRCCDAYAFKPQLGLCFRVTHEDILGNGDLVRTTFKATHMRLSFRVRARAEPNFFWEGPRLHNACLFSNVGHSHDRTLILLKHFDELWRPAR